VKREVAVPTSNIIHTKSGELRLSTKVGTRYIVDTLQDDDGRECTICFEEFHKGDMIARMDCFCIFHKNCLERWFNKVRTCPLHKD